MLCGKHLGQDLVVGTVAIVMVEVILVVVVVVMVIIMFILFAVCCTVDGSNTHRLALCPQSFLEVYIASSLVQVNSQSSDGVADLAQPSQPSSSVPCVTAVGCHNRPGQT